LHHRRALRSSTPSPTPTRRAAVADAPRSPRPQGQFPAITKGKTATVRMSEAKGGGTYSYNYADLGDVLGSVRPVLAAHGLALVQRTRHLDGQGWSSSPSSGTSAAASSLTSHRARQVAQR
jgi:hypothetical protein